MAGTCSTRTDRGLCGRPLDANLACDRCDRPNAPALAYYEAADRLPEAYFTTAPPAIGIAVRVTDPGDHQPTEWLMTETLANAVVPVLRQQPRLVVQTSPYNRPASRPR